ncbi:MAG: cytochrome c, partial [Myxococcota bacterium]
MPDFTDCSFASREPDGDWLAVASAGGPVRGFDHMMAAFGDALTEAEIQKATDHIRTFCRDDAWPRGELNLPKALFTEKAFPEDEVYFLTGAAVEGEGSVSGLLVYEKRFGARNQIEVAVPFSFLEAPANAPEAGRWRGGIGDIGFGLKRVLLSSLGSGSIASLTAELIVPTGDAGRGFGGDTFVFEPFLTYGQIVPVIGFVQMQGGFELPFDTAQAENEWFVRSVIGRNLTAGEWGRVFSPMLGVLAGGVLSDEPDPSWDLVPQMLITLNTRQHVMLNAGVRLPVTGAGERDKAVYALLLWDWFDGGFFEGW